MSQKAKLAERILYASKAAKIAKASRLGIAASAVLSFMIFAISFYGEQVGNFTFSVDQMSIQAGITLFETLDGENNSILFAPKVDNADGMTSLCGTPYTRYQLGDDVCVLSDEEAASVDGANNMESVMIYTFYVMNAGDVDVDLSALIDISSASKGAEEAIRVRVLIDGPGDADTATTYAKLQTSRGDNPGENEIFTEAFYDPTRVMFQNFDGGGGHGFLSPGDTLRVTVMLWFEGEDADHNLNIVGGGVRLEMEFSVTKVYDDF
jgi:hypothetical protein